MSWLDKLPSMGKPQDSDLHEYRYAKLQEKMKEKGIDHLLIEDPVDIFYVTGVSLSAGCFLAHQSARPDFMLDSRYFEGLAPGYWKAHLLDKGFWTRFWQRNDFKSLGFDPDKTTYTRFQELSDQAVDFNMRLEPQKTILSYLQRTKDSNQIKKMEQAGILASQAFEYVCEHIQEGVSERQLARMIRLFFVERGADVAFEPHVAFGHHSSIPHSSCGEAILEKGQLVLIDLGAKLDHYCSDMTRTCFFDHVGDPSLERIWNLTHSAYQLAYDLLKPGLSCGQLDRAVREFFKKNDIEEKFLHSLGHGIGLRVHEPPRLRNDPASDYHLEVGSIITIEPGLYLPGVGGVRLENTLAITEHGVQLLTPGPFQLVL